MFNITKKVKKNKIKYTLNFVGMGKVKVSMDKDFPFNRFFENYIREDNNKDIWKSKDLWEDVNF